jgi:predicted nucleotidyltransferase component of viral defense system
MPEFLHASADQRTAALEHAANISARPPHLLEKDVWVVWTLRQLFEGPYAEHLVFKGGTSLSKAYSVIRRFSEDVDLTYDIRAIAGDLVGDAKSPLPVSKSQEKNGQRKSERAWQTGYPGRLCRYCRKRSPDKAYKRPQEPRVTKHLLITNL